MRHTFWLTFYAATMGVAAGVGVVYAVRGEADQALACFVISGLAGLAVRGEAG